MHNYNDILKELRTNQNITQKELGIIFNLTQRQISTYETGRNEPEYKILKQYAKYFNVSTDYILGLTKDPRPNWVKQCDIMTPIKDKKTKTEINNSFNNNTNSSFNNIG